jgi:hypothetical protein
LLTRLAIVTSVTYQLQRLPKVNQVFLVVGGVFSRSYHYQLGSVSAGLRGYSS